jgi:hypothetical protein
MPIRADRLSRWVGNDPVNAIDLTGLDTVCVQDEPSVTAPDLDDEGSRIIVTGKRKSSPQGSGAGMLGVISRPGTSGRGPQKGLLDYGKDLICGLPAISPGLGADLYAGAGGSLGGGLNIDIAKGQFGVTGSLAVGLGLGVAVGPGVNAGPSGSSVVSANLAVGGGLALPVAPGVNVGGSAGYNVLGTDPGFSGGSIGRFGTPVGYVNGGANFGFNTPPLYDLGCKK